MTVFGQTPKLPFVGCLSDGQMGPLAAPQVHLPLLSLSPEEALHLSWFQASNGPGVLAPRGWNCFGTYGSSGATLYVSPTHLTPALILGDKWKGFTGPAIQISIMNGGTSGRFDVAGKIARLFPDFFAFTRQIIAEGSRSAADFPRGPYPHDKLTYQSPSLVYFETPARLKGLGTDSRLLPGEQPITGLVFLSMKPGDDPYDISLEIRLSPDLATLAPVIRTGTQRAFEATAAK